MFVAASVLFILKSLQLNRGIHFNMFVWTFGLNSTKDFPKYTHEKLQAQFKCLVSCVVLVGHYLSLSNSFGHCIVCPFSIYGLPLWYFSKCSSSRFGIFQTFVHFFYEVMFYFFDKLSYFDLFIYHFWAGNFTQNNIKKCVTFLTIYCTQ